MSLRLVLQTTEVLSHCVVVNPRLFPLDQGCPAQSHHLVSTSYARPCYSLLDNFGTQNGVGHCSSHTATSYNFRACWIIFSHCIVLEVAHFLLWRTLMYIRFKIHSLRLHLAPTSCYLINHALLYSTMDRALDRLPYIME